LTTALIHEVYIRLVNAQDVDWHDRVNIFALSARIKRAARKANVRDGVHVLQHTFCSHLAMRGAPGRAIQELAGHSELGVTQRYMHLSPPALDAAIRLLDGRDNIVSTGVVGSSEAGRV
jgi:integrase